MPKLSLRDLFAVVTIVALALGWWLDRSRLADRCLTHERQTTAVQSQLQRHGQTVVFGSDGTTIVLDYPP